MLLDDLTGDRQAQPGALGLGGEERLEQPLGHLVGDAGPVVAHAELHGLPVAAAGQRELVAPGQRLQPVLDQIQDGLTEQAAIDLHHRHRGIGGHAQLQALADRQRADELTGRLQKRLAELEQERRLSPLPPVFRGGALVVPAGLIRRLQGVQSQEPPTFAADTERSERLAMQAIMETERRLGYHPRDVSHQNLGYDIESAVPDTGRLRFLEVKGRPTYIVRELKRKEAAERSAA